MAERSSGLLVPEHLATEPKADGKPDTGGVDAEGRTRRTMLYADWKKVRRAMEVLIEFGWAAPVTCTKCGAKVAASLKDGDPNTNGLACDCTTVAIQQ